MTISRITYIISLATAAILMGTFEFGLLPTGVLLPGSGTEYLMQIICVALTLASMPLALKWRKIAIIDKLFASDEAEADGTDNQCSDICRIAVLYVPLILNVLCYYLFGNEVTFAYMALMILVGFAFIWPQSSSSTINH